MRDKVGNPHFQLEKAVEKIIQNQFPELYMSRYRLVTFTNVPYAFARQAGEICDDILQILCKDIKTADQVDLKQAEKLIKSRLTPLLNQQFRSRTCWQVITVSLFSKGAVDAENTKPLLFSSV